MALKINLYKNTNSASKTYGLIYGRVENYSPMSLKELAGHMHDHNSPYDEGLILGVLTQMVKCIRELVLDGKPVKLDNLAIIKCQVTTKGAASYAEFDLGKNVKDIRLSAIATGEFTRAELTKSGRLAYTSLAESLRTEDGDTPDTPDTGGND